MQLRKFQAPNLPKMKKLILLISTLALISATSSFGQKKIMGYFPDYRLGEIDNIQWNKLTDVVFAFINADANGNLITTSGSAEFGFNAFAFSQVKLKCQQNNVNLLISVGGADNGYLRASRLRDISRNTTARNNFATQIVNFAITNSLTGIDLDWEFPNESIGGSGGNTTDHKNLIMAVRTAINASSKPSLTLGGCVGGEYTGTIRHTNYVDNTTIPFMDYIMVMSYDLPATYDANNHSPLTAAQLGYDAWAVKAGNSYTKVLLGVPFYGRRNSDRYVDDNYMYRNLSASNPAAAYNADNVGTSYYNGKTTLDSKIDYVVSKGGPGIFIWDIGQDRYDQYSLLSAIKTKVQSTCPIPNPNLGPDQGVCIGTITLTSGVAVASGRTFTWQKDGSNVVTNSTTQTNYVVSAGGTYKVIINEGTCSKEDVINVISGSSLTVTPANRCGSGLVTLTVNQTGGTYDWYNASVGGPKLTTGQTYTTTVTSSTTFYVQQNTGSASYIGGKPSLSGTELNTAQNEAASSTNNLPRWANKITVGADLTINTVMLYRPAVALNNARIYVISAVDGLAILKTSTGVNIPAAGSNGVTYSMPVNIQLTPGTYYVGLYIPGANGGGTWPNLLAGSYLWPSSNFPSSTTGIFTISGQAFVNYSLGFNASPTPSINYGQLFNWDISTGVVSPCGRTLAVANVNPGADISKTITTTSLICPNTNGKIGILSSEANVLYQALIGSSNVGSPVTGNGSDIELTIPFANLNAGPNNITISATKSGCGASNLTALATITVRSFPTVSYTAVPTGSVCQGNNATINLSGSQANLTYQAYISSLTAGPLVNGTGSAISLSVLASKLIVGQNIVYIKAVDGPCAPVDILTPATVNVTSLVNPTLTMTGFSKIYGDAVFTVTAGSNSTGALTYSVLSGSTFASIGSTSGQVTINGAGAVTLGVSQAAIGCFNAATTSSTLTIAKKSLGAKPDDKSKLYNTANPPLTISYTGFVGSDNASGLDTPPTLSTSGVTNSPVGTYPIVASGGLDNNYSFSFTNGTLTVTKATPSLSITSANSGQAGSSISLTASSNSTGAITWSVVSGNGSISGSTLSLLSAGSVTIQASLATDANYNSATVQQTITISALTAPTITYNNVNKIYGDAPFAATASSNSSGALTYSITSGNSFATINPSTGTVTILGAGTVTLKVDQAQSGTFAARSQTATLTIAKKTLTATAVNVTRAYNTANPTFTVTFSGFVGTDNASVIDIQPSVGTSATISSNAGTYTITVSGGSDNNYALSYASGTLTITKITPTLNITSANVGQSGTSISLTASSNSTGAITWTVVSGNGTIAGNNVNLGGAGSVTVQANLAADVNYNAATSQQVISITTQTVPTITYGNATKTYGDAPFAATASSNSPGSLTYSIVAGNTFAAVNPATGTVTVLGAGSVTLKVDQAANGSFSATSKTATLTIGKKALTATADGKTRAYNTVNPTFSISYSGFVNSETASVIDVVPTAASSATQSSNAGTYAIVPSGGSDNNYSFNFANGTLTITSVNPTLSITSANSGQAGSTINLTASSNSTGAVTWSVVSGNGSISGSTLALLSPSSVTVQASLAADVNYKAATVQQSITITPKTTPTITFANFSATFGDAAFTPTISTNSPGTFTYSITGGNAFATINSTSGLITILGAGTVTIQVNQASSGTFAATSISATLTINKANRTVNITSANSAQAGTTLSLTGNTSPTGGTISWSIQSQSGTSASVSGSTLTAGSNSGSLVIKADVAADANYNAASATQTVNISTLTTPTITYSDVVKTYGNAAFNATASSNSAGALTYSITSGNSFATINPSTGLVTINGAGTVTLQVSQAANGTFAATTKTATLTINKATRTATITSANLGIVGGQINLTANVSPTATINWSVTNGTGAASVNTSTLNLVNAGTVTINANIAADANYLAASASQIVTISQVTGLTDDLSSKKLTVSVSPNPYETEATLIVNLPSDANVSVEVFNTVGIHVTTLTEKTALSSGSHSYTLGQLPAATYLVKVTANDSVQYLRVVKQ